jgi:hypothetical protein
MESDGEPMETLSIPMENVGLPVRHLLSNGQGPVYGVVRSV